MSSVQSVERSDEDFIQSASITAMMRAVLNTKENLKNPDYLAKYFVDKAWSPFLENPDSSIENLEKRLPGGIYYILIRTKYFDDSLLKWIKKNPDSQVVMLGAGFDTRALRFTSESKNIEYYEVDLKAMLEYKKNIIFKKSLNANGYNNINYIPTNFQTDDLFENLNKQGFDNSKPTYFLCEGITFFLGAETIDNLFENISRMTSVNVMVAFDYAFSDYIDGDLNFYGAKETYNELQVIKEPHVFGINYEDIDGFFHKKGFESLNNYTAGMLDVRYIANKYGDNFAAKSTSFFGLTELKLNAMCEGWAHE